MKKSDSFRLSTKLFKDILNEYSPESLCVLGCTTGNGFEHIKTKTTNSVVGIDINEEYLRILKERFGEVIPEMVLICSDLNVWIYRRIHST
jgi:ubiquinone/menaquinone biosynthesis C-methylase UbiE